MLGRFADRVGFGTALSAAVPWTGERAPLHDRGTALTHAMLMLAAGGEACSDIEFLVAHPRLFGLVTSDSTLYRTIQAITPAVLDWWRTKVAVALDAHMRDHAQVEDHIKRLKDSGLERFPFTNLDANRAWMQLVCLANDLVRWFQHFACTGPRATAEPKRMRWTLWHNPARIVRRAGRDIIRIIDHWPTTQRTPRRPPTHHRALLTEP